MPSNWNFNNLPKLPPPELSFYSPNLILQEIELGIGWVTFWGRGDVLGGALKSALAMRQFYLDIFPRLPFHVKNCQPRTRSYTETPRPVEDQELFHPLGYNPPVDLNHPQRPLDHIHILYPYLDFQEIDFFEMELLLSNVGFTQPVPYTSWEDRLTKDKVTTMIGVKQKWQKLLMPPSPDNGTKFLPGNDF